MWTVENNAIGVIVRSDDPSGAWFRVDQWGEVSCMGYKAGETPPADLPAIQAAARIAKEKMFRLLQAVRFGHRGSAARAQLSLEIALILNGSGS